MSPSRRSFMLGLGASLFAAPFVGLLGRSRARAAAPGDAATRLVVFFTPNGTIPSKWRPSGSGTSFTFPAGSMLEPLAAHRDNLVVVGGLDFKEASNHEGGMAAMLTGKGRPGDESAGLSVDQFVASRLGGGTRFPSLEIGVQTSAWGGSVQTRMSYRAADQYAPPDDSPMSLYTRLYGDAVGGDAEAAELLRQRRSVLDLVRGDVNRLRGELGGVERAKLDAHLEALRDLERGLGGGTCAGGLPVSDDAPYDNDAFPSIGRSQMDLLVAALACDATRVASLQWAHTVAPHVFRWLNIGEGHHSLSHMDDGNTAGVAQFVQAERWFAEQFGYLLDRLAATPDPVGEGSLLDTTLVLWCKEMGDSRLHVCTDVPFVLAGKAGGRLSTGRYLRFDGESHTKLLLSVCHAMGLENQSFGNPSYGAGELAGLL